MTLDDDRWAAIESRYEDAVDRGRSIDATYQMLKAERQSHQEDIEEWSRQRDILEHVEDLYRTLLDRYVYHYAESFSDVVTEGLQSIFYDRDLEFDVDVSQKRSKVWLDFQNRDLDSDVEGAPLDSFGGGVAAVESLILRVLVILKKDMARYLLLDESLGALSDQYVEACCRFIQTMCDRFDLDVLLITQNRMFEDYADRVYRSSLQNNRTTRLDQRKPDADEDS